MSRGEIARDNFMQGYNCAQAVLLAFSDLVDVSEEDLVNVGKPFGAGVARMRLTCGTVNGMVMAIGLVMGKLGASQGEIVSATQQLVKQFETQNGSIVCADLLSGNVPQKQENYKKRACFDLCFDAADILEKYLQTNGYIQ